METRKLIPQMWRRTTFLAKTSIIVLCDQSVVSQEQVIELVKAAEERQPWFNDTLDTTEPCPGMDYKVQPWETMHTDGYVVTYSHPFTLKGRQLAAYHNHAVAVAAVVNRRRTVEAAAGKCDFEGTWHFSAVGG